MSDIDSKSCKVSMISAQPQHSWRKTSAVGFPSPGGGFWAFLFGLGAGMFLGPELISLTKTGKERLRELAERKIRG